jgi:bifunctional ADP-heptose synthase (sugar kinase/adenylyltransferase)
MDTLTAADLDRILAAIPHRRIGLVGDLFLDRYLDLDPARDEPSVETGLTAYQVTGVRNYPGALGTVLNNLVALGVGTVHPITFVGDDGEGSDLLRELRKRPGVTAADVIASPARMTPTYTKPMYETRELNRLDIKNRTPTPNALQEELLARLTASWPTFDAVIVLDQVSEADCGVVTARVRERVAELAAGTPAKFVLADSRERIGLFRGMCIKPNEREGGAVAGWDRPVFQTLGERGIQLLRPGTQPRLMPGYPVAGPVDICGAGDSCSAGIAAAKACGATDIQAAMLGNLVASVTVRQIGVTGTATPAQLRARWAEVTSPSSS